MYPNGLPNWSDADWVSRFDETHAILESTAMNEGRIVGIDLGTTNSLVGAMDSGFPLLFPNSEGRRLTPSVVAYPEDGVVQVGSPARRRLALEPATTLYSTKRFIGRSHSDLQASETQVRYPLVPSGSTVAVPVRGQRVGMETVASAVLSQLKTDAEKILQEPVSRAVVTVPAYFNDAQRNATKRAGEAAGLQVVRILNEPTAAALAFGVQHSLKEGWIAVYDLGGGTFDISILKVSAGVFEVKATCGNTCLGGDDIDARIVERLTAELFAQQSSAALDSLVQARLGEEAERVKILLSEQATATVQLPFAGNSHFQRELSRGELEALALPVVERTRKPCFRALSDAGILASQLDRLILVGGQSRMPLVRRLAVEIFGREPDTGCNPDEAVALGAVLQAGILEGSVREAVLLDVTPLSLGIETFGGLMNVIIPRNTAIPAKAGELFTNAVDGQRSMQVSILQGERELAKDNWKLGELQIGFAPCPRGTARVGVQFQIDENGILRVLARDTKTGGEQVLDITAVVDVEDARVEEMVAASVEHALEDMGARRMTELRLKSQHMIGSARAVLSLSLALLEEGEQERIISAITALEKACNEAPEPVIKSACAQLDEVTRPLAQRLLDAAYEKALEAQGVL